VNVLQQTANNYRHGFVLTSNHTAVACQCCVNFCASNCPPHDACQSRQDVPTAQ